MNAKIEKVTLKRYEEVGPDTRARKTKGFSNPKGIALQGVAKLKTLYWIRRVLALAGCVPSKLAEKFVFDIGSPEFELYARGRRLPAPETLAAVDRAHTARDSQVHPFAGLKDVFLVGPDGQKLWNVLEGDKGVCVEVLDLFLEEEMGMPWVINANFQDKVDFFYQSLLLSKQIEETKSFKEFVGTEKDFHRFCSKGRVLARYEELYEDENDFAVRMEEIYQALEADESVNTKLANMQLLVQTMDWFKHPFSLHTSLTSPTLKHYVYVNFLNGQKYPFDILVAALALRVVAFDIKSHMKEADYLMVGVLRVLAEKMPEISEEILNLMFDDIQLRTKTLHRFK